MKQIHIFILELKLSINVEKIKSRIQEQVNQILSTHADKNAELVAFIPKFGAPRDYGVVIQYDE